MTELRYSSNISESTCIDAERNYSVWSFESATEMHRWFRNRKRQALGKKHRKPRTSSEQRADQELDALQEQVLNGEPIQKPIVSQPYNSLDMTTTNISALLARESKKICKFLAPQFATIHS